MAITQDNHIAAINIEGQDKDALCLAALAGREELGRLFQYEVELVSENHNVTFEDIIGHKAAIRLNTTRSQDPRYFHGHISRFTQEQSTHNFAVNRATIVPWLWLLTRTSDCCIWSGADKL